MQVQEKSLSEVLFNRVEIFVKDQIPGVVKKKIDFFWKIPTKPPSLHQHEHNNCHRHTNHMQIYCSELLRPAIGVTLIELTNTQYKPGHQTRAFFIYTIINGMKTESTISIIKQELISMFASLDAWFDKLLDDGLDPEHENETLEIVTHIFSSNYNLLNVFPQECDDAFASIQHHLTASSNPEVDELRMGLRNQLYQALCLIDTLDESALTGFDGEKQMELHDKLFSIAQHLRYHLELLELEDGVENA